MSKVALLTGASSGLGKSLAPYLSLEYELILVARNSEKLEQTKSICLKKNQDAKIETFKCDLTDETQLESLKKNYPEIDLLINCAGVGFVGASSDLDMNQIKSSINLNILALVNLTDFYSKKMVQKKQGTILNVASLAGLTPIPYFAVYAASKSFVISYSISLANELKNSQVRVKVFCPGGIDTDFLSPAGMGPEFLAKNGSHLQSPDEVAKDIIGFLKDNRSIRVSGSKNKMMALVLKFLPMEIKAKLSGMAYRSANK